MRQLEMSAPVLQRSWGMFELEEIWREQQLIQQGYRAENPNPAGAMHREADESRNPLNTRKMQLPTSRKT